MYNIHEIETAIKQTQERYNSLNKKYRALRFFPEERKKINYQLESLSLELLQLKLIRNNFLQKGV